MTAVPPRLLIAANLPMVEAFLLPYARHFRGRGWRVDVVANGASRSQSCQQSFDQCHEIAWTRRPRDVSGLIASARTLRRLARTGKYDIVHVHNPIPGLVARWALRHLRHDTGTRIAYTAHGFHFYRGGSWARNAVFEGIERLAGRWTDEIVVINREDYDAAVRFPKPGAAHVHLMPGIGVDVDAYAASSVPDASVAAVRADLQVGDGDVLLLMVAEFNPGKRHRDAVRALAQLSRPDIVLACAGRGPLQGDVAALAQDLGVASRVRLLGYRHDIPALIRAADALILPSEREGLPRSILEAMCLERPVIATRIRGVTELVSASSGILCEVGDVGALASAIRDLADHADVRERMGREARCAVERFSLCRVLRDHEVLYAQMLDRAPRRTTDPA